MKQVDINEVKKFLSHRLSVAASRESPKEIRIDKEYATKLWLKQKGLCAISGKKMTIKKPGSISLRVPTNCSIDRINNNRGYIPGNVHLVCWQENNRKRTRSLKEYIKARKSA
jgi:5-methylcytosine-specific restriction endonuclease McrA